MPEMRKETNEKTTKNMVPDEPFIDLSEDADNEGKKTKKKKKTVKKNETRGTKLYQFLYYLFELCMFIKIKYNFRAHSVPLVAVAVAVVMVALVWENFANPQQSISDFIMMITGANISDSAPNATLTTYTAKSIVLSLWSGVAYISFG